RNDFGTPLLDDAFRVAQERTRHGRVCYANADIILLDDFVPALGRVRLDRYLLVGRRTDLDVPGRLDFDDSGCTETLARRARTEVRLFTPDGIDYFVCPRGQIRDMPPFP